MNEAPYNRRLRIDRCSDRAGDGGVQIGHYVWMAGRKAWDQSLVAARKWVTAVAVAVPSPLPSPDVPAAASTVLSGTSVSSHPALRPPQLSSP